MASTGYGDGCYPVYVRYDVHGFPVAVEVRFLEENEDSCEDDLFEYDDENEDDEEDGV